MASPMEHEESQPSFPASIHQIVLRLHSTEAGATGSWTFYQRQGEGISEMD